jgi:hypothetical protein
MKAWECALINVKAYEGAILHLGDTNEGAQVSVLKPYVELLDYDAIIGISDDTPILEESLHFMTEMLERYRREYQVNQIALGGTPLCSLNCRSIYRGNLLRNSKWPWLVVGRWTDRLKADKVLLDDFLDTVRKKGKYVERMREYKEDSYYFNFVLRNGQRRTIAPWVSRANHIGRESSRGNWADSKPEKFFQTIGDPSSVNCYDKEVRRYEEMGIS